MDATALGFGRTRMLSVMGQPFEAVVVVRVETPEDLAPNCVSGDVFYGETRLERAQVSVEVQAQTDGAAAAERRVRVRSSVPVDEPVVSLYLTVGCTSRVTRKWVGFADPPSNAADRFDAATAATAEPQLPDASVALSVALLAGPPAAGATGTGSAALPAALPSALPGVAVSGAAAGPSLQATSSTGAEHAGTSTVAVAAARPRTARTPRGHARAGSKAHLAGLARRTAGSRLQMDVVDTPAVAAVPQLRLSSSVPAAPMEEGGERRTAAAALWRILNATPEDWLRDQQRLAQVEAGFERLRGEVSQSQQALVRLEARLQQAQARDGNDSTLAATLAALAVVLGATVGWLAWQRRRDRANPLLWTGEPGASRLPADANTAAPAQAPAVPVNEVLAAAAAAGATVTPVAAAVSMPAPALPRASAVPEQAVRAPAAERADRIDRNEDAVRSERAQRSQRSERTPAPVRSAPVLPSLRSRPGGPGAQRQMSVEELIDLEQQAEFFVVLGQDEAAIDLLLAHMRNPGATSPLPYLKLLEIYQRRGDRGEYDRVRDQFNTQFNAYAPPWEEDLAHGQALDDYPSVVGRLQRLWPSPPLALEVLQSSLMARNDAARPFALPAYRELLLLYSIARDLAEHEEGGVDLLLPIEAPEGIAKQGHSPSIMQPLMAVPELPPRRESGAAADTSAAAAPSVPQEAADFASMSLILNLPDAGPSARRPH